MRHRAALTASLLLLTATPLAHDLPTAAMLVADLRACDPMTLETDARALGAAPLSAMLLRGSPDEAVAAARGARGVDDPWSMVGALATAMAGSDPVVAPAAAMALLDVVAALRPDATVEHLPTELPTALAPALALADDVTARPDLRDTARALRAMVAAFPGAVPRGPARPGAAPRR